MILSLLRRKLAQAGIQISLARMVQQLVAIREVAVVFPAKGAAPTVRTVLSKLDAQQRALYDALDLARFHAP
jgi:hypothetical protein